MSSVYTSGEMLDRRVSAILCFWRLGMAALSLCRMPVNSAMDEPGYVSIELTHGYDKEKSVQCHGLIKWEG